MTEIGTWLEANGMRLVEIAQRSDIAVEVVHLAAVLVLDGLTDTQIREQLQVLEVRLRGSDGHDPLDGLPDALTQIRGLIAHPAVR